MKTAVKSAGVEQVVVVAADAAPQRWTWLPSRQLFRPLIADPRWPRCSAAYQYHIDGALERAAVSFGDSFNLLQFDPAAAEFTSHSARTYIAR